MVAGILFKLCHDPVLTRDGTTGQPTRYMYGGTEPAYELAAKACSHDLKGAMAYLQVNISCHVISFM